MDYHFARTHVSDSQLIRIGLQLALRTGITRSVICGKRQHILEGTMRERKIPGKRDPRDLCECTRLTDADKQLWREKPCL